MTTYAIEAVRIDQASGAVTHVRWGAVSQTSGGATFQPVEADVDDVVHALLSDDTVHTVFALAGGTVIGPEVEIDRDERGRESIKIHPDKVIAERALADLPRF